MDKTSQLLSKGRYSPKLLKEAKEKYPRFNKQATARLLKNKRCPHCLRKLHKAIDEEKGSYYCTCDMEVIISLDP